MATSSDDTRTPILLERALNAIRDLRRRLDDVERARSEPVAITGLSCRFPGAGGPDAFWRLLHDGQDAVREVPAGRWDLGRLYHPDPD
ncbi:MAG: hypothetical protein HYY06_08690 [Deltaproteobacteria bacterium]|nr:hypothetical protein [Deltaproteobacteria bacterium]